MKKIISHPGEKLEIVDDKDKVIDIKTRKNIHENNLLHREIAVLIFNNKGELMLSKLRAYSSLWDISSAGHVSPGQTYKETALREVKEELGIEVSASKLKKLFKFRIDDPCFNPTNNRFIEVYRLDYDVDVNLEDMELETTQFFSVKELKKMIKENKKQFSTRFLEIFERV